MKAWLIALAIIVAGLALYTARLKPHILDSYDQPLYLVTAAEAAKLGPGPHDAPLSIEIAPLYPVFIAALTHLDPRLAATVACIPSAPDGHIENCPNDLGILVWAQLLLAVGTGLLLWRTAYQVTLSRSSAWIALAAASFGSAEYAEYAHAAMTETPTFFFFAAFDLAFLLAIERRSVKAALAAGALLGLTTLTRPIYLYLALVIIAAALVLAVWHGIRRHVAIRLPALRLGLSFAVAFAAIVGPWIARNEMVFGVANVTQGYGPFVLVQRLAYDDMRPKEWLTGWIYFLPDFGHSWSKALFPAEDYQRLAYDTPDNFYVTGVDLAGASAPLGGQGPSIGSLLRGDILPHLGAYIAVTLLLAWRGLWIGRYFSVVTVPMLFWRLARVKDPRWPALAIVAAPPLFVLFLNAAVSGDAARYNIILEPVMAIAAGQVINAWAMRWRQRLALGPSPPADADRSMPETPTIAVVLPCYRVRRQVMAVLAGIAPDIRLIYCVDDACPEHSGDLIESENRDPRVRVIRHERNLGVGGAVMTGYRAALGDGAEIVVKLDADGQMDPRLIANLIAPILLGRADYTKGNRFFSLDAIGRMPASRLIGNAALSFFTKLSTGYWTIFDPTNGFTAIHQATLRQLSFDKIASNYFFESDMLFRLNIARAVVEDVPMTAVYGTGQSSLRIARIIGPFWLGHLRNFSKRLFYNYFLRDFHVASLELVVGLIALIFGTYLGISTWIENAQSGTTTPAGTVMLAGLPIIVGIQLLLSFLNFDMRFEPTQSLQAKNRGRRATD